MLEKEKGEKEAQTICALYSLLAIDPVPGYDSTDLSLSYSHAFDGPQGSMATAATVIAALIHIL